MSADHPEPLNRLATAVMRGNRSRDTTAELRLRSALHRAGFRFRVNAPIAVDDGRPIRPDIVFPTHRLAVFVDGCFWHGCPEHGSRPSNNARYWESKFARNRARDDRDNNRLRRAGWRVIRIWEHVPLDDAVGAIARVLRPDHVGSLAS